MTLAFAALYGMKLLTIDIKAAYRQPGSIKRDICARPPLDARVKSSAWKSLKNAYGMKEAGGMWRLASDEALTNPKKLGLELAPNAPQLFVWKKEGKVAFLAGKLVDNFLRCGSEKCLKKLCVKLKKHYAAGAMAFAPDPILLSAGAIISHDNGDASVNMKDNPD